LRAEAEAAYRRAVEANPQNDGAWNNLGFRLGQQADAETDAARRTALRTESQAAYRRAVEANPQNDGAWDSLAGTLIQRWWESGMPAGLEEALKAAQRSADLGGSRYNLACALALSDRSDEAIAELRGCLARLEISREHVAEDHDWDKLRDDARFKALMDAANGLASSR
jgi:tetratricopeptide (TPR) repeat protein